MKNNRGLTLVELLGVLVILSLLVMIVTPSITRNLKESSVELCYHQLDSLVSASKNWLTDQINDNYNNLYIDGVFQEQIVTGEDLLKQGYVDELDEDYYLVKIEISKSGDNYNYIILRKSDYCE